jgi:hypothetical protein
MKTPRGYRRLPNGLLKKSTAGGRRKRKARGRKKRKQRGRGHKKGHKGGGVLGYAGLRAQIKFGRVNMVRKFSFHHKFYDDNWCQRLILKKIKN